MKNVDLTNGWEDKSNHVTTPPILRIKVLVNKMVKSSPPNIPTRLAWLDWYTDHENQKRCNFAISEQPLSNSTNEQIELVVNGIAKIRPLLIFFEIFRLNYSDLESAYQQIDIDLNEGSFRHADLKNIDRQALLQQRVINFVNSAALMIERAKSRMNRSPNMIGFELDEVKAMESIAYDQFRSYRLCCSLRNYSQHDDLPIHAISIQGRVTAEGWGHSLQAVLKSDNLKDAKQKLRKIVSDDYADQVDLVSELQSHFAVCAELFAFIVRPALEMVVKGVQLRSEVLNMRPKALPTAEPVLWQGDFPTDDGASSVNSSSFSFGEIERWGATYSFIEGIAPGFSGIFPRNGNS